MKVYEISRDVHKAGQALLQMKTILKENEEGDTFTISRELLEEWRKAMFAISVIVQQLEIHEAEIR